MNEPSIEAEANAFAMELLLPEISSGPSSSGRGVDLFDGRPSRSSRASSASTRPSSLSASVNSPPMKVRPPRPRLRRIDPPQPETEMTYEIPETILSCPFCGSLEVEICRNPDACWVACANEYCEAKPNPIGTRSGALRYWKHPSTIHVRRDRNSR